MPPAAPRRVLVVFNPIAGRRRHRLFRRTLDRLIAAGCVVTVRETGGPGDAEAFAREANLDAPTDVVAAAGGDGTLNEVVNGLAAMDPRTIPPALATVPLGTINVLAWEIGLPVRPDAIAEMIASGPTVAFRPGLAGGRRFMLTAGVGIDAAAVDHLSVTLKRLVGRTAYMVAAAHALIAEGTSAFEAIVDGKPFQASSVVVTHASRYASPQIAAPGAALTDDHLHALVSLGRRRRDLVRYAMAWSRGRLPEQPDIRILPARSIETAAPADKPVQLDGDLHLRTPVTITLDPRPLQLVVPAAAPIAGMS